MDARKARGPKTRRAAAFPGLKPFSGSFGADFSAVLSEQAELARGSPRRGTHPAGELVEGSRRLR